jgi:hypothetical protein
MWSSGFLPTRFSGVAFRGAGDPVLYLPNPPGVSGGDRRTMLDAVNALNQRSVDRFGDPETQTRIAQYEMAFRMQSSVPDLTDLSKEPQSVLDLYGPESERAGLFATAPCSLGDSSSAASARAVAHRGWDQHSSTARATRRAVPRHRSGLRCARHGSQAARLARRTLVVWGGEFGRTVYSQGKLTKDDYGRDHHPRNFCMWLAGGGIKGGQVYGETDDFSYNIVDKPVHVNDLNATILHCLGIDHSRFTYKFQGLDAKLTGVEGAKLVKGLLA